MRILVDRLKDSIKRLESKIATGEDEEEFGDEGKNKAAQELGRNGGKARAW